MDGERSLTWKDYCVTLVLFCLNVVGYVLCRTGDHWYEAGSLNAERILADRQYYRLVTCMFLHADIEHIVSNMIFLIGLGEMIERAIGHVRFGVLYMVTGISAGILSVIYSVMTGDIYDAVGASGAIFGLIGALFILVVVHNGRFGAVSIGRLVFAVAYMIYSGVTAVRVDNAAHVGGLAGGILTMAVMNVLRVLKIEMGGHKR